MNGYFSAPDYALARLLFERLLAGIYLLAFLTAVNQFRPLLGERGLLPAPLWLRTVSFRQAPSIFHLHYSDRFALLVAWSGAALSAATLLGLPQRGPLLLPTVVWLALWALYLSIVNVGQIFYAFGWESLLLETGLLATLLGDAQSTPSALVVGLMRWLLFRLELGAGLIKIRGDSCWRDLTCLDYHHQTQPMPNPLSWYFHHLPKPLHKLEVAGNHFAQLVVPFGLLAPQPVAGAAGLIIVVTQLWLILSGNFAWLNYLAISLAVFSFDDAWLRVVLPLKPAALAAAPLWFESLALALSATVLALSYWPIRNMVSRRQAMNRAFNRVHFVNTYGAFGRVTRVRHEIVIEGTEADSPEGARWQEYGFKGKPGDPRRRPRQVSPYHLRLDWLMWFAALSPSYAETVLPPLLAKLLENDPALLRLLGTNPFPERPPSFVRARFYRYRFSSWREKRQTGAWWVRELVDEYLPPVARSTSSR